MRVTLLSGTSAVSSEPGRALARLAKTISDSAGSAAIVRESSSEAFERLRSAEAGVAKAIDDYLDRYGYRPMSYDPGDVTLAERPSLLIGLLRDELDRGVPSEDIHVGRRTASALTEARARLTTATEDERERFETALAFASDACPSREDNILVVDGLPSGLIRRTAVEVGRRLAERGELAARRTLSSWRTRSSAARWLATGAVGENGSGCGRRNEHGCSPIPDLPAMDRIPAGRPISAAFRGAAIRHRRSHVGHGARRQPR